MTESLWPDFINDHEMLAAEYLKRWKYHVRMRRAGVPDSGQASRARLWYLHECRLGNLTKRLNSSPSAMPDPPPFQARFDGTDWFYLDREGVKHAFPGEGRFQVLKRAAKQEMTEYLAKPKESTATEQ